MSESQSEKWEAIATPVATTRASAATLAIPKRRATSRIVCSSPRFSDCRSDRRDEHQRPAHEEEDRNDVKKADKRPGLHQRGCRSASKAPVVSRSPCEAVGAGKFAGWTRRSRSSHHLHPSGLPHGPQPGLAEKSIGMHETHELAVMCDTFHPLKLSKFAKDLDDGKYAYSWYEDAEDGAPADAASADGEGDASGAGLTSHF